LARNPKNKLAARIAAACTCGGSNSGVLPSPLSAIVTMSCYVSDKLLSPGKRKRGARTPFCQALKLALLMFSHHRVGVLLLGTAGGCSFIISDMK
jgi:hypothetical protein